MIFKKTPEQRIEMAKAHDTAAEVHKAKLKTSIRPDKKIGHILEQAKHKVVAGYQRKKAGPKEALKDIAKGTMPETADATEATETETPELETEVQAVQSESDPETDPEE